MRRRLWMGLSFIIVLLAGLSLLFYALAPESSSVTMQAVTDEDAPRCLLDADDACYIFPQVTATSVDNQTVAFPQAFAPHDYTLLVLPFDQNQQTDIITWLPLFQELAARYEGIGFYNIAPLSADIGQIFRPAIIGGMRLGVRDPAIRPLVTVTFLEDQAAFVAAIGAETIEQAQILIVDTQGRVLHRDVGSFTDEKGESFAVALDAIVATN